MLEKAGMGVAAISYDSRAILHDFAVRKAITFPLLSDHESNVIRAYGVADRRYRKNSLLDVDSSGEVPVYGLAYPSVFVLSPDGTVRWRFVAEHEELRLTAANILRRSVGQIVDQSRTAIDAGDVHIEMTASDKTVGAGARVVIGVEVRVPPGLHVYAPNVGDGYRGIAWRMDPADCSIPGEPDYPAARMARAAFADAPLPVYQGTFRIDRELIVKPMVTISSPDLLRQFRAACLDANSRFIVSGSLEFQACSDRECFPPRSVPLKWIFDFTDLDRVRAPVEHWRVFEQP